MRDVGVVFLPVYRITPGMAAALMSIEADRQAALDLPHRRLDPGVVQVTHRRCA